MEYLGKMTSMFNDLMTGLDEVDAFLSGKRAGYKVTLPDEVDVKGIRKKLKMTQARFSDTFGFSLDAVKHWEGGRRTPESSARAFLTVIAKNPVAVITALHSNPANPSTRKHSPGVARRRKSA
jgi:putative transcriptional regulator